MSEKENMGFVTRSQLEEMAKECAGVEVYRYSTPDHRLHGDFLSQIGDDISDIPFVGSDGVKADVYRFGEDDYNTHILPNTSVSFADIYNEGDVILVVILPYWADEGAEASNLN